MTPINPKAARAFPPLRGEITVDEARKALSGEWPTIKGNSEREAYRQFLRKHGTWGDWLRIATGVW